MPLTRLLAATLLACSTLAVAQLKSEPLQTTDASNSTTVASSEPWQVIPKYLADPSARTFFEQQQIDKYKVSPSKESTRTRLLGPEADSGIIVSNLAGQPDGSVTTCLKIRSYVVARDSKDSDSTHPVSYSTCQPSSRYQVRTAEVQSGSPGR